MEAATSQSQLVEQLEGGEVLQLDNGPLAAGPASTTAEPTAAAAAAMAAGKEMAAAAERAAAAAEREAAAAATKRAASTRAIALADAERAIGGVNQGKSGLDRELAHKQQLVDRLLDDVERRSAAVARCTEDITGLRGVNSQVTAPPCSLAPRSPVRPGATGDLSTKLGQPINTSMQCHPAHPSQPTPTQSTQSHGQLQREVTMLRSHLAERDHAIEQLSTDATNTENIDTAELRRRHRLLGAAYRTDRRKMELMTEQA